MQWLTWRSTGVTTVHQTTKCCRVPIKQSVRAESEAAAAKTELSRTGVYHKTGVTPMRSKFGLSITLLSTLFASGAPLFAAPLVPQPTLAGPPVMLRYKFVVGDVQRYRMAMDMNMTMSMPGGSTSHPGLVIPPMKMHMDAVMARTIKSVNASDGAATVGVRVESVTGNMNGQTLPQIPDTAKMEQTMTVTPRGRMTMAAVPGAPGAAGGIPGMPGMPGGMNMGDINSLMAIGAFPETPVGIGQSWTTNAALGTGTKMTNTMILRGVSSENGHRVADMGFKTKGNISFSFDGTKSASPAPFSMSMNSVVSGSGTQKFDLDAGALRAMAGDIAMDMTMKMGAAAGSGQSVPPMKMHIVEHLDMSRLGNTASKADSGPAPSSTSGEAPGTVGGGQPTHNP